MSPDQERDLLERCQVVGSQDFEEAFGAIYRKYKDRVYSLAYRITGSHTDALDAAQEAFVLLYQYISSFQYDSKFSSWLYSLVVKASIDHLRRTKCRRRKAELPLDASGDALALRDDSVDDPSDAAGRSEMADRIQACIQRLSPKLRVVTVLRYQQNQSYEEIAETLGISLGTVKSRLSRAHLALGEILRPILERAEHGPAGSREERQEESA